MVPHLGMVCRCWGSASHNLSQPILTASTEAGTAVTFTLEKKSDNWGGSVPRRGSRGWLGIKCRLAPNPQAVGHHHVPPQPRPWLQLGPHPAKGLTGALCPQLKMVPTGRVHVWSIGVDSMSSPEHLLRPDPLEDRRGMNSLVADGKLRHPTGAGFLQGAPWHCSHPYPSVGCLSHPSGPQSHQHWDPEGEKSVLEGPPW